MRHEVHTAMVMLTEEACEIGQVVQKIHRFGLTCHNPEDPNKTNNRKLLSNEVGDMLYVVELLVSQSMLRPEELAEAMRRKCDKLKRFTSIPHDELPMPCTILLANPPSEQVVPSSTMHAKLAYVHDFCKRNGLSVSIDMQDDGNARVCIIDKSYEPTQQGNVHMFTAPYLEQALDMTITQINKER